MDKTCFFDSPKAGVPPCYFFPHLDCLSFSLPSVQNVTQAKPTVNSSLTQAVIKPVQADLDRQRAFVERQHIERQLNAAMAQAYAQNKRHRQIASMVRVSQGRYTDQRLNAY